TEPGILAFANRWGNLHSRDMAHEPVPGSAERTYLVPGVRLSDWRLQIGAMREAVQLWDAVLNAKRGDESALRDSIRWERDESGWRAIYGALPAGNKPASWSVIVDEQTQAGWLKHISGGADVIGPAMLLLQRWCNRQLQGQVSSRLLY